MFENALREIRQEKNLSQLELGRRSKIAPATISLIEAGKQYPYPGWRKRLAVTLDVGESELFPNY